MLLGRRKECDALDALLDAVRAGESRTLVVRGEAGVGKSALLDCLVGSASGFRVERAVGVEGEMELPFAGLEQLCGPMLDRLGRLPAPQRDALGVAFGLSAGEAPDRFLVGLAVLSVLSEEAEEQPLVCVVDDAQWLDRASAQALAFVTRRLQAESVALVFAVRDPSDELRGLPELVVHGLHEADAQTLLGSVLPGRLDEPVRERILAETRGNPLAVLELARVLTAAELAGGFGLPGAVPLSGLMEDSFRRRLEPLPANTRRLLLLAATEPLGDPVLLWRGAKRLGIGIEAADAAESERLFELGARVTFRHPLVRSAVYGAASPHERREVHRALAEATDPAVDPDRRAWYRGQATPAPDECVALELERSASRAQARGGLAAAAAFLERAALLTPEPGRRGRRMLAAARAKRDAGALDAALGLLVAVEAGPLDAVLTAEVERLRGQVASQQQRGGDAARLLLSAATRLAPLDADLARETHLEGLVAAMWAGDLDRDGRVLAAAEAARAAPPASDPPRAVDVLLDAFAIRLTEGYTAAVPALKRALELLLALDVGADEAARWLRFTGGRPGAIVAVELWDAEAWRFLTARQVQVARDAGALVQLRLALNFLAFSHLLAGELTTAAHLIEEDRLVAEATGIPRIAYAEMMLLAWRGEETRASELIEATLREAAATGVGRWVTLASYASSVLENGLGRHDAALTAAWRAFECDPLGFGPYVVPELAEAASRTGDEALVRTAIEWLSERTLVTPTEWGRGLEARFRALLSKGDVAERSYRESIERLARTSIRVELARGHLVYGEWLRRERRRADAREPLRTAHEMFRRMGAEAFAARAERELLATGETTRKRRVETRGELTPHELRVARMARDGASNQQIATRLFVSRKTVEYHLHNVFTKLGINSRERLDRVLPED
jgi:DNA-binding CsgD family transcriptional regulator